MHKQFNEKLSYGCNHCNQVFFERARSAGALRPRGTSTYQKLQAVNVDHRYRLDDVDMLLIIFN